MNTTYMMFIPCSFTPNSDQFHPSLGFVKWIEYETPVVRARQSSPPSFLSSPESTA